MNRKGKLVNKSKAKAAATSVDDEDLGYQFVTFRVAEEDFALPMDQVAEIIRLPQTVGVPLTPSALVGLANLRGNVLPIVDLRRILQLNQAEKNDSTRVIVVEVGRPIGLIVDKVAKVIHVDELSIDSAASVQSAINTKLLNGVIRVDDSIIQLLDVEQLIKQDFSNVIADKKRASGSALASAQLARNDDEEDAGQLVSFTVNSQEYALDLMSVEEIIRVPNSIVGIPSSAHHILGMIDLRGRLLPLVSLRRMFLLEELPLTDNNRVLVIGIKLSTGISSSMGIVVDEVREVFSVPLSARDKVPRLLTAGDNANNDIIAVCRLQGGKRLVSILSAQAMFESEFIEFAMAANSSEIKQMNNEEIGVSTGDSPEDNDTQMVVFKLADQEYGVTIDDVQEITRIPVAMSRVPKTAKFVEGIVNLRGTVLPVLDMRARFGMEPMARNERQRILVLNLSGCRTGFIMDSVVEVLRLSRMSIEISPNLSDDQMRVMGHVVNFKETGRMIQVLDVRELLSKKEERTLEDTLAI
jgi:purine-binding chemotaxis protein CheW